MILTDLFKILDLFADLFDQYLQINGGLAQTDGHGLRSQCVGLAVELLHHEIKPLAARSVFLEDGPAFGEVALKPANFLGNVDFDAIERNLLRMRAMVSSLPIA